VQDAFTRLFGPEFGHGKPHDLARMHAALAALGKPQERLPPVIHVAGTNGKGSTIAFMRAIAEAAGLRVHAFTKPHLITLNERFLIAGDPAQDEILIAAAERVADAAPALTQFEAQVAAALLLFSETPAELCLLETGMGGLDDATNVVQQPSACVLAPIDLDHQEFLGPGIADIAGHKAGILKPGTPAIVARQPEAARTVIEQCAAQIGAPLYRHGVEWDACPSAGRLVVQTESRALDLPPPALHGAHQFDNAGLAAATLIHAGIADFSDACLAQGVANARWPGRLHPLTRGPYADRARAAGAELWIDGGHNLHAARALAAWLASAARMRPAEAVVIIGMRKRKDWRGFLGALTPMAPRIVAVPVSEESADPAALAAHAAALGLPAETASTLEDAVACALSYRGARLLICGSLLLASEALARLA
jgi:dihydrofolate synthase/folylpolyglutamate synthase